MKTFLQNRQRFPVRNKKFLRTQIIVGGIAVRLSNVRSWVRISPGATHLIFSQTPRTLLQPLQPSIQWILRALVLLIKRPWPEFNRSPPTNVEVKDRWSCNWVPPIFVIAWAGNSYIFTFIKYDIGNVKWRLESQNNEKQNLIMSSIYEPVLDAFAKLLKATVNFVMSVCPQGTTLLP